MARQEPADSGEFRVNVYLGPANRRLTIVAVSKAANREPAIARRSTDARSQFGVGDDHLGGVDSKAYARCEGDEVVEGHNLVYVGVRGAGRNDGRAGSFTRRYQMVLAKQSQRLADRVPANRKPQAEL